MLYMSSVPTKTYLDICHPVTLLQLLGFLTFCRIRKRQLRRFSVNWRQSSASDGHVIILSCRELYTNWCGDSISRILLSSTTWTCCEVICLFSIDSYSWRSSTFRSAWKWICTARLRRRHGVDANAIHEQCTDVDLPWYLPPSDTITVIRITYILRDMKAPT